MYTAEGIEQIMERCTKLRQLSLPLPDMEARSGKHFDSDDLKRQMVSSKWQPRADWMLIDCVQAAIMKLPDLDLLSIQDWPATNLGGTEFKFNENLQYYNIQLSSIATHIFATADDNAVKYRSPATRSSLSHIAFGMSHWSNYDGQDSPRLAQILFMRGMQVDPFGGKKTIAVQVEKGRLLETGHEDESIVGWDTGPVFKDLDYVLYKE